ncbi:universal stress protein [Streptomyces sp. NBC_00320]|uniref:universal stress protein n=1 Tax=Streptomyces sp. NBC_00320 TaxID=2975711 RepID=UPI002253BD12|nr:universal stress protein [Streptomyces sp. NBC_00320]MCX5151648.1 universal stress protein [Streptomyces sp. NBC_00320]
MSGKTGEGRELVVGIDPARDWHLALAWAADEAHRRRLGLHLVAAVPPQHDTHPVDDTPHQTALRQAGAHALEDAVDWARDRHPELEVSGDLQAGPPAAVIGRLSQEARMVVLGSRHLSRTAEFFSAGSLVVPVAAQAGCPVVVVGDAEHVSQQPPYVVVGIDGSESSKAALAFACEEADLRGAELRVISVFQSPVLWLHDEEVALQAQRRMLAEATAGWPAKYPDVAVRHEIPIGHPVEELAKAAEHALAVVVGRRGRGGYSGMHLGSVVHGLLHRAHCPVITVPTV